MRRAGWIVTMLAVLAVAVSSRVEAAPFYEGRSVRITVGFSAGGGFDLWARLVSRHLGKHIPGNPSIIVENVTGAGGLIQVNQLYAATKPDGLTIGHINGGLIFGQILGQPGYEFDSQKFVYIGAASKENPVFCLSKKSGVSSAEQWRTSKTLVKAGGLVPGNLIDNVDRVMKDVLGFPIQIVSGYKGTADVRIAVESGELTGAPAPWDGIKTSWKRAVDSGDVVIVAQGMKKPLKEIAKVPRMIDFAKTEEQKKIVEIVIHSLNEFSRPFVVPPGTPKDRVDLLRKAFEEMLKDPDFLSEVEKMKVSLDPSGGEELASEVAAVSKMDAATREKLKNLLLK